MLPSLALATILAAPPLLAQGQDPAPGSESQPDAWPHWQGPRRDGISLETNWAATGRPDPLWSRELGLGYSNVSIADGRLFTCGFDPEMEEDMVWCLDPKTGEEIWVHPHTSKIHANFHGGGTLTTPSIDGDRVYVSTRFGRVFCLATEDGAVLWDKNYAPELSFRLSFHGCSASPLVLEDRIILTLSGMTAAVKKDDGAVLWKTEDYGEGGYTNPVPLMLNGERCLVVLTGAGLALLATETGEQLQFYDWPHQQGGVSAATPLLIGSRVFISAAYDKGASMVELGGEEPGFLWHSRRMRNKVSSCVLWEDHLYGFDESMLKCMDLDGNEKWRVRGLGMGTVGLAGGRLIVLSSKGELLIGEANPDGFEEDVRRKVLDDGVYWTAPVLLGGLLYCRNSLGHMVCLDHRTEAAVEVTATTEQAAELPAAATLFAAHVEAIGGEDAWRKIRSMQLDGELEITGAGITRTPMTIHRAAPALWHLTYSLGRFGTVHRAYDGKVGWQLDPFYGNKVLEGDALREQADLRPFHAALDFARTYDELRTVERTEFANRPCWMVEARSHRGAVRNLFFDVETGLQIGRSGETEAQVVYADHRAFEGLLLPTKITSLLPDTGEEETYFIAKVTFDQVDPEVFARPSEVVKMLWTPEEVERRNAEARAKYAEFLGTYIGNFEGYEGEEFVIDVTRGDLTMEFPGAPGLALEGPDEEGWFSPVPGIPLRARFEDVEDGKAQLLHLELQEADPKLPRKEEKSGG